VGPKVHIGWYRNGKDLTQWVSRKRLVKTMERAHLARIKASNEEYQSGALGWE
jgi:hypothetical protein